MCKKRRDRVPPSRATGVGEPSTSPLGLRHDSKASDRLGSVFRVAEMEVLGSEEGGVNAMFPDDASGVLNATGDASFVGLGAEEGVCGVRGAKNDGFDDERGCLVGVSGW